MNVEIKHNAKELLIENLWDGDIFIYNNETFIRLTDELFLSNMHEKYNAVNLETGEPEFFSADTKVIYPNNHTLTVEL